MDNPNQFRLLDNLPNDVLEEVFFHLGVASVCRFYTNCSSRELRARTAEYLKPRVVRVTAEEVIEGDLDKIDFYEYGQLPKCHIEVETSLSLLQVVFWHLRQVQYESLRFTVMHDNPREPIQQLSLEALVGNVVALTINGCLRIDSQDIPTSVTKVELNCRIGPNHDFRHLVNLTHFSGRLKSPTNMENWRLPHSVVTLGLPDSLVRAFDASSLTNLKHIDGGNIVGIPWEQIETARLTEKTGADRLSLISTGRCRSFRGRSTPKLKEVVYAPSMEGGDVSELFTDDQLARLTLLWGGGLTFSNMDRFEHLTKVSMRLNEDFTEDFPLPPTVIDFRVKSIFSVYGIPPWLEKFSYSGDANNIHVNVKSAKLKSLSVFGAESVAIDCPELTTLKLGDVDNVGDVKAPLVWKLSVDDTIFPVLAANPDGSDKFIWLKDLEIVGTGQAQAQDQPQAQDIVTKHDLRSVTLRSMVLGRVSITADKVTFLSCRFVENAGPPKVKAKVLSIENTVMDTSHVWCQELCVSHDDPIDGIMFVPQMVEKLITDSVNLAVDNNTRGHGDGRVRWGLSGCNKLRSVEFVDLDFEDNHDEAFIIPASVRQVKIFNAEWQQRTLRFEEGSQLEHIECWSPATMGQLGLTKLPPSLFHAGAIPYYAFERLRPHRN